MNTALETASAYAIEFLENFGKLSVNATGDERPLRERLDGNLPHAGMRAEHVVDRLVNGVEGGLLGTAGAGFSLGSSAVRCRPRSLPAAAGLDACRTAF